MRRNKYRLKKWARRRPSERVITLLRDRLAPGLGMHYIKDMAQLRPRGESICARLSEFAPHSHVVTMTDSDGSNPRPMRISGRFYDLIQNVVTGASRRDLVNKDIVVSRWVDPRKDPQVSFVSKIGVRGAL